jgi:osmotically-inducible protein OsmY
MRYTAFLACFLLLACSRSDKTATEEPAGTTTITSAPVTLSGPSDEELIRRAESRVASDSDMSMMAAGVEIEVTEGVATLRGAHPDPDTVKAIEAAVARVPGITATLNKTEIRTPTMEETDDTIAFTLQRSLLTDTTVAAEADSVTIDVNNGMVTLRGPISGQETRAAVEKIVEATPGVVAVQNQLKVRPQD